MKIHYVQHVPFENPGRILSWAAQKGHRVSCTRVYANEALPEIAAFDWLVVMGGPMNIYEESLYPWLAAEKAFIRRAIDGKKVVLGLCLGGQLIADVIGGKVTGNRVKEIGWHTITLTAAAKSSPLFSYLPASPVVFQWHGDTFGDLPESATLLARSEACDHQAFVYKKRVFGFQYHLENTAEIIAGLVANCGDELVPSAYVQTAEEILGHPECVRQDNEWMDTFLSNLEKQYEEGSV